MSKSYAEVLGAISPTVAGGKRAADIVAALAPPPKIEGDPAAPVQVVEKKADGKSVGKTMLMFTPGLVGGVGGAVAWKEHRVLGFLLGHAVGDNLFPIIRGGKDRKDALFQLGVEGAGIVGSLSFKKHPILGWIGGVLAGSAVTALVPGSPTNDAWLKFREDVRK